MQNQLSSSKVVNCFHHSLRNDVLKTTCSPTENIHQDIFGQGRLEKMTNILVTVSIKVMISSNLLIYGEKRRSRA